jgi:glutathione S-transferase
MAIDFFHGHGSPFSWRVWLALEHKKVPYELKVLSFAAGDTKKPEFVALNPRHRVPTIVDDGFVLWESGAILEYLEDRFPEGPKLYPGDAKGRAQVRRLAREAEEYLYREGVDPIVDEFFWKGEQPADMEKVAKHRERVREELAWFEKAMAGAFLAGDAPTAADFVLYPNLAYLKRVTFRKPEAKLTELIPPGIAAWMKRIESLPYFDKTIPEHWRAGWA